ncbi:hypothetical protein [uncultured Kocuria sp.]|uniref:hypothetical protein n=1 Tax=uncultured Kocuria sp. TaxID=259305 RepID=UPI002606F45D|nr:hypothetical protein [uncultured Kocuria sp.]
MDYDVTLLGSYYLKESDRNLSPKNRFAKISKHRSFIREFGLQSKHEIHPVRYTPGNQFRPGLGELASTFSSNESTPYKIKLDGFNNWTEVIPRVDQFGSSLFVSAIRYRGTYGVSKLSDLLDTQARLIEGIADVAPMKLLKQIAALAAGVEPRSLDGLSKRRMHSYVAVDDLVEPESFYIRMAEFLATTRRSVVALHISGEPRKIPDARLESALLKENSELNLKSETQLLFVNAQGSTLIAGTRQNEGGGSVTRGSTYHNRHARVVDLSEIATAMQHLLLRARSRADIDASAWAGDTNAIDRWVRFTENVLHTSVSNQKVWSAVSRAYALPSLLNEFHEFDTGEPINGLFSCGPTVSHSSSECEGSLGGN